MFEVALRGLLQHKARLITTFLAVALGVAFVGGVLVLTDTMNRSFDDLFADVYRDTDAVVRSSETIGSGFAEIRAGVDADLLDVVAGVDEVAAASGDVGGYARIIDAAGEPVGNPAMGAPTLGGNWTDVDELNPFDVDEGRAPETAGEIVIDRGSADATGYRPGDEVPVQTRDGVTTFDLVGIVRFGTADSPGGASYVLWTVDEAQELLGERNRYGTIGAVAAGGVPQGELAGAITAALQDAGAHGGDGVEVLTGDEITAETQSDIKEQLSFITQFFLVFAIVAVVVGTFVIYNSFKIIVAQRTRELALLRAIGARRRQVRRAVVVEAALIGLTGSVLGFLAGLGVASFLATLLQVPPGALAVLPVSVATAVVTGVVVTVVSALLPAWRASRVPPLAAMRAVAVDTTGRSRGRLRAGLVLGAVGVARLVSGALDGESPAVGLGAGGVFLALLLLSPGLARPVSRVLGAPLARLRGVAGGLARDNAGRNPRRTAATAQALMIGVGLVAFILVVNSSIRASIDKALDESFSGDFVVGADMFGMVGLPPEVAEQVGELPEVAVAAPVRWSPALVEPRGEAPGSSDDEGVAGAEAAVFELLDLPVVEGDAELGRGEVVVNTGTAEREGLTLGDPVRVDFIDDRRPADERVVRVSGIYDDSTAAGGIGNYVIGLDEWDAAVPSPADGQVFVQRAPGVSVADAEAAIEEVVEPHVTAEVQSVDEYKDAIGGQLDVLLNLVVGLLALAMIIASLGIANTIALSVLERTREIGLLRAVGMRRRQLRSTIRWEAVIISLYGSVLGLVVGLLGGWGIVRALRDEGFGVFSVPGVTLVVLAAVAGLLGLVAALLPAWRASRMNVLEAIATE